MKRFKHALFTTFLLALAGICFLFTPYGQRIEEDFGLSVLFKLRGPRHTPEKAVIINIDDETVKKLGLTDHYSKWPRTVHARLVDRLSKYGAEVIVFDIHFAEEKSQGDDTIFTEAIKRAGNVILVEKLLHKSIRSSAASDLHDIIEMDTLVPPIKPLADAALALAPFPLPKLPVRVNRAWLFKASSGDTPTLPAVVFQASLLHQYGQLQSLLSKIIPNKFEPLSATGEQAIPTSGLVEIMRKQRELFLQNSALRDDVLAVLKDKNHTDSFSEEYRHLHSLINMYGGEGSVFIDYYGPPTTHLTLTYHDILSADEENEKTIAEKVKDKVVFVGAARKTWSNQKDGFYTVFSQKDGLDLSGVELAATVFSNLFENRSVHKLSALKTTGLIFVGVTLASLVSFFLQPIFAAPLLMGGVLLSLLSAQKVFSSTGLWVPLITPMVLLPFAAFIIATLINFLIVQRERKHISAALGFYLPDNAVKELTRDLSFINKGDQMVYSACLMTDAKNYTSLSERLAPEAMSALMKEYYQYLFREVKEKDGLVCNVIGDAMLAMWPAAKPKIMLRENACQAAIQIAGAVDKFNATYPESPLPTRIGLHAGYLLMGNIGAEDHFEYAPVGDIVNTASRIEGLNKQLATQVLVSKETLEGVTGVSYREVGRFLLGGKTKPVTIYELLMSDEQTSSLESLYADAFPMALERFRTGDWNKALVAFEQCLALNKKDGPSRFYRKLCRSYLITPPPIDRQGIIKVMK